MTGRPPVNPDLNYLPRTVKVGDRLRLLPSILNKQDNGSRERPQPMDCVVIYVHPKLRFATVEFQQENRETMGHWVDASWRETWHIMPEEDRLAHKEPPPKPPRPLTERLQEKNWSGMTSTEIARELGSDPQRVTSTINALGKRGINVPYKKIKMGRPRGANRTPVSAKSRNTGA